MTSQPGRGQKQAGELVEAGDGKLGRIQAFLADRPGTALFVLVCALYLATATYSATSIDVVAAEEPAWALAVHGTLDLSALPHHDLPWYFEHDGGVYSDRFPGAILFLVPIYWAAGALGVEGFSMVPGSVSAALTSAAAVSILRLVFQRTLTTPRQIWAATVFAALGTGAWSVAAHAPWSHTFNLLLISLTLLALSHDRWGLAGLPLGLATATRPTVAIGMVVLGGVLSALGKSIRPAAALTVGSMPGVLLLFAYNGLLFGRWGPTNGHELGGEVSLRLNDLPMNIVGAFVSPSRGLVFFYPLVLVAALGFSRAWSRGALWERAAFAAGVAILLTQLALNRYSGGDTFFGPRLMVEPLAFAAPLLARATCAFAERFGERLVRGALLAGVLIHGVGGLTLHLLAGI